MSDWEEECSPPVPTSGTTFTGEKASNRTALLYRVLQAGYRLFFTRVRKFLGIVIQREVLEAEIEGRGEGGEGEERGIGEAGAMMMSQRKGVSV